MKITNKKSISGSISNNETNLKRCIIFQIDCFHLSGLAIQASLLEEELGNPRLISPLVHWQCVLIDILEGPGVLIVPDHNGFQFVARNIALKQHYYPFPNILETKH